MNNCRWDNTRGVGDQVDSSNSQTSSSGKVECTCEWFSCYSTDDLRAKIEPPSCRQHKPGELFAVRPQNCDEIIDEDDDDENRADSGAPSSGRSHRGDGKDNDGSKGEDNTQGGEQGTGRRMGTKDEKGKLTLTEDVKGKGMATEQGKWKGKGNGKGKGKGKGKGIGNGKGKGIIIKTPGGESSQSSGNATGYNGNGTWRAHQSRYY